MGVRLFFVISGFLISGILLKGRRAVGLGQPLLFALRQFYLRRFLRIFPLYYLVVAIGAVLGITTVRNDLAWYLTYTINYRFAWLNSWEGFGHFWSLAVEEQFYVCWPLAFLTLPTRWLLPFVMSAIAAGPLTRVILVLAHANDVALEALTPVCVDSLALGALLAVSNTPALRGFRTQFVRSGLWCGLPLLTATTVAHATGTFTHISYVLFDTGMGLFCVWLVSRAAEGFQSAWRRVFEWPPLLYCGTISYGVYVFHYPLGEMIGWDKRSDPRIVILMTAATFALASASWHFYERPINGLKRHLPYEGPGLSS